ncbi:MAG TPA: secretion protein HlyD [Bdellovibrionales bacterium]|nr:secretion protein HlyD [Pseudobdellovibrionaceae bacterium]HAG92189.1 secretion protein HlyD [Bdellovibrionales bacterium]|tara:strand:+ start:1522 stop:2301 length:780 start_codon:yes stop_codon:yes gene_type:complete
MKKKWLIGGAVLLVLALSLIFYSTRKSYESVSPKIGDLTEAVYGLGTVKSNRIYEVKLGVLSSIRKVHFKEGEVVPKGSVLITFDEGQTFRAPFDGTLTSINFHDGEIVPPQATVLREEDVKDLYIEVSLEQESALRVVPGQPAKILFESLRGNVFNGKVSSLFPKNGEFLAHIEVEKLGEKVLPQMTADVTIEVGKIKDAKLIPYSAVHNGMVVLRRNGKKKKVKVKIGHVDDRWAEVTDDSIELTDEILIPQKKDKN